MLRDIAVVAVMLPVCVVFAAVDRFVCAVCCAACIVVCAIMRYLLLLYVCRPVVSRGPLRIVEDGLYPLAVSLACEDDAFYVLIGGPGGLDTPFNMNAVWRLAFSSVPLLFLPLLSRAACHT